MDGQLLSGIGSVLGGTAALGAVVAGAANRQRIADFLKSRTIIIGERDHAREIAQRQAERADSAERSAQNLERAAEGAESYARTIEQRLFDLEQRMTVFDKLCVFARELLEWAMLAEKTARAGGVILPPIPPVPTELIAALRAPHPETAPVAIGDLQ